MIIPINRENVRTVFFLKLIKGNVNVSPAFLLVTTILCIIADKSTKWST